jgi:glutamate N-acetyltransferase / amino-acid N-acetyltransferase
VKTALFGRDANWGRILAAAGSAPHNGGYARVDPSRLSLSWNGTAVLIDGAPQHVEPDVDAGRAEIALDLGLGEATASYLTSDLSYEYVRINAEYRS